MLEAQQKMSNGVKEIDFSQFFTRSLRFQFIKLAVIGLVALGTIVGLWFFNSAEADRIAALRERRLSMTAGINAISTLSGQKIQSEDLYVQLKASLQDELAVVIDLSKKLRLLGEKYGLRTQADIGARTAASKESVGVIEFTLRADGGGMNFGRFVKAIESSREFYRIDLLGIGPLGTTKEMQLKASGKVFIRP